MKKRPLGVTIVAALFVLFGTPGLLSIFYAQPNPPSHQHFLANIVLGIASVFNVVVGGGLLMLHRWAYWMTLVGTSTSALVMIIMAINPALLPSVLQVLTLLGGGFIAAIVVWFWGLIGGLVSGLGLNGLIIWYFLRPSVKAQFTARSQ